MALLGNAVLCLYGWLAVACRYLCVKFVIFPPENIRATTKRLAGSFPEAFCYAIITISPVGTPILQLFSSGEGERGKSTSFSYCYSISLLSLTLLYLSLS